MASDGQALVNAERAVREVLASVNDLRAEAGNYHAARTDLNGVRGDIERLAGQLGVCAEKLRVTAEALGRIGTSEILARIDQTAVVVEGGRAEALRTAGELEKAIRAASESSAEAVRSGTTQVVAAVSDTNARLTKESAAWTAHFEAIKRKQKVSTILAATAVVLAVAVLLLQMPAVRAKFGV